MPLGSYRTWVKYVEKGVFPDVRRFFSVLRCNHCDDAPCITICPVTALFRRSNGIVDFDHDACIGCKACMQACPYDALYIHPETGTAAKCNFCAHRVENEIEPPCATVCPTESIVVGDLDDHGSRVSHLVATERVSVRKPEKGTRPKVFYIEGEPSALTPGIADPSGGYLWADGPGPSPSAYATTRFEPDDGHRAGPAGSAEGAQPPDRWIETEPPPPGAAEALAAAALRGDADFYTGAWAGLAPARTVYDVAHAETPWGWKVSAYLWTKSIAAGAFLVAALAPWLEVSGPLANVAAPALGLLFLAITGLLLVIDLKRPSRFWTILTRPNWDSWLARGAFIIAVFAFLGVSWGAGLLAGFLGDARGPFVLSLIRWPLVAASLATAGYSGYLFAQAKGRDFWQNPLLPVHFCVQAMAAGSATLVLVLSDSPDHSHRLAQILAAAVAMLVGMIAFGEVSVAHATRDGARAAHAMVRGRYAKLFWSSMGLFVVAVACALLGEPVGPTAVLAGIATLAGLALYEHAWNLSGQAPPLS